MKLIDQILALHPHVDQMQSVEFNKIQLLVPVKMIILEILTRDVDPNVPWVQIVHPIKLALDLNVEILVLELVVQMLSVMLLITQPFVIVLNDILVILSIIAILSQNVR